MSALIELDFIVDVSAAGRDGLLAAIDSAGKDYTRNFVFPDGYPFTLRCVRPGGDVNGQWDYLDLSGAAGANGIEVGIGLQNQFPTGGSFMVTFGANTTGALAYNISNANLQTALNALASITSAGNVTVSTPGTATNVYRITFNTAGAIATAITTNGDALFPLGAMALAEQVIEGDTGVKEVWEITMLQAPYALSRPTAALPTLAGTVTAVTSVAGTANSAAIQRVKFDPIPYAGTAIWNFARPEKTSIVCLADVAGSLHLLTVATIYDQNGPVLIYLTHGGGSPPAAPVGGRTISVTFVNSDSAATIGGKVAAALALDAQFSATTNVNSVVTVIDSANGTRTAAVTGTAAFGVTVLQTGCNIVVGLNYASSTSDIATAMGDLFTVANPEEGVWDFTATDFGAQPAITVTTAGLKTPIGVSGTLDTNTDEMRSAFNVSQASALTGIYLFVRITNPGEKAQTILLTPTTVTRGFFDSGSPAPVPTSGPRYNSTALTIGQQYVDVNFAVAMPNANWHLRSAIVLNTTDATPLVLWPGVMSVKTAAGCRIFLNSGADTTHYTLETVADPA